LLLLLMKLNILRMHMGFVPAGFYHGSVIWGFQQALMVEGEAGLAAGQLA
jgi:hypothetical protein